MHLPHDRASILEATLLRTVGGVDIFEAKIAREVGKSIRLDRVFLANLPRQQVHISKTERGAVIAARRSEERSESAFETSRNRVTSALLRTHLGWCAAGILDWCKARGVRRNLAQRLRDGVRGRSVVRLLDWQKSRGASHGTYEEDLARIARRCMDRENLAAT